MSFTDKIVKKAKEYQNKMWKSLEETFGPKVPTQENIVSQEKEKTPSQSSEQEGLWKKDLSLDDSKKETISIEEKDKMIDEKEEGIKLDNQDIDQDFKKEKEVLKDSKKEETFDWIWKPTTSKLSKSENTIVLWDKPVSEKLGEKLWDSIIWLKDKLSENKIKKKADELRELNDNILPEVQNLVDQTNLEQKDEKKADKALEKSSKLDTSSHYKKKLENKEKLNEQIKKLEDVNTDLEAWKIIRENKISEWNFELRKKIKDTLDVKKKKKVLELEVEKDRLKLNKADVEEYAKDKMISTKKKAERTAKIVKNVWKGAYRLWSAAFQFILYLATLWPFLLMWLLVLFVVFIFLVYLQAFWLFLWTPEDDSKKYTNEENKFIEQQILEEEYNALTNRLWWVFERLAAIFRPTPDWSQFVANSEIPHGVPMTWTITQGYCSSFQQYYIKNRNWFEEHYCRQYGSTKYKTYEVLNGTHAWIDMSAWWWTKVYSTNKWKVVFMWYENGWWNTVEVEGRDSKWNKLIVKYNHLRSFNSDLLAKWQGPEWKAGTVEVLWWDLIGIEGNTWAWSWAHLDYRVCWNISESTKRYNCYWSWKKMLSSLDEYKDKAKYPKGTDLPPCQFIYNYEINGKEWDPSEVECSPHRWKYYKSGIWPWLPVESIASSSEDYLSLIESWSIKDASWLTKGLKMTDLAKPEDTKFFYTKVWLETNVSPLLIWAIHKREKWAWVINDNASQKCHQGKWWSCKNEWVYGFYEDHAYQSVLKLHGKVTADKYCNPSDQNWWKEGWHITYEQFEKQTTCFALAFPWKLTSDSVRDWWVTDWAKALKEDWYKGEWTIKWKWWTSKGSWAYFKQLITPENYMKYVHGTKWQQGVLSWVVLRWNWWAPSYYWNNAYKEIDYSKPVWNYDWYIYFNGWSRRDRNDWVLRFSLDKSSEIVQVMKLAGDTSTLKEACQSSIKVLVPETNPEKLVLNLQKQGPETCKSIANSITNGTKVWPLEDTTKTNVDTTKLEPAKDLKKSKEVVGPKKP